jgi:hypothetical protein
MLALYCQMAGLEPYKNSRIRASSRRRNASEVLSVLVDYGTPAAVFTNVSSTANAGSRLPASSFIRRSPAPPR